MSRSPKLKTKQAVKVVVLVLENDRGDILITQRQKHQHLSGYWEFPGGKIEPGETAIAALERECNEELNHSIQSPQQILTINHSYPDIEVTLLIYHELSINPKVFAAENQPLKWVTKSALLNYKLPEANQAIVEYLNG